MRRARDAFQSRAAFTFAETICKFYTVSLHTMIKAIPQRNRYDCAYATVAMAADVTYRDVETLAFRIIRQPKLGLTPADQLLLLHKLTGESWEEYEAPARQLLTDLSFNMLPADDGETEEDIRLILSTFWHRGSKIMRHSIFSNGYRIFDPARRIWFPFSKIRRMRYYRNVYVRALITQKGTFVP